MPRFDSALCPRRLPMQGSIGAPWGPLLPARSHTGEGPTVGLGTSDNSTDWNPYTGGNNLMLVPSDVAEPLPCRPAIGDPYVTPSGLWNVAGPSGLDQGEWPIVVKGPSGARYYQFGFNTPGQQPWGPGPHVALSLPSVPPPMPFLGQPL